MPSLLWGQGTPRDGQAPCRGGRGMSGDAEVPGRFGARGGLFTVPPLDSDRRHVIGAVLDVCREQSEDYVDRRKVDYRVLRKCRHTWMPRALRVRLIRSRHE